MKHITPAVNAANEHIRGLGMVSSPSLATVGSTHLTRSAVRAYSSALDSASASASASASSDASTRFWSLGSSV